MRYLQNAKNCDECTEGDLYNDVPYPTVSDEFLLNFAPEVIYTKVVGLI
jgi:hypothetical protein